MKMEKACETIVLLMISVAHQSIVHCSAVMLQKYGMNHRMCLNIYCRSYGRVDPITLSAHSGFRAYLNQN